MPNRHHSVLVLVALSLAALGGCRNACQTLCVRMADYAEECGQSISDAELDTCLDEQSDADDVRVCRDYGDPQTLRDEWTCEEVAVYWGGEPAP